MKRLCERILVAVMIVLGLSSPARAATISLIPSSATVLVGGTFDILVTVSGLHTDFTVPEIVSAYDLVAVYTSGLLGAPAVAFGADLGGPIDSLAAVLHLPGSVNIAEVSLLLDSDLDVLQGDSVTLAALTFTALTPGTATLAFLSGPNDVTGLGALPIALTTVGTSVVNTSVPEPSTILLVGSGFVGLVLRRRVACR